MDREFLLSAFRCIALIRDVEGRFHKACLKGQIHGFTHLYEGSEASAAGICSVLNSGDHVASSHRAHGHYIAKGGDLDGLVLEVFGRADGICGGKGGTMHVADWSVGMMGANGIVAASVPHAVGAAFAARFNRTGAVAVSFSGDGAANQGVLYESINLAKVFNLPVVFVTEDNGYAETTASSWAIGGPGMVERAKGFGLPAESVDGADFFAVHAAALAAVTRAREDGGPSFINIDAPMFRGHYEGDAETYRPAGEVAHQRRERNCLELFRERVLGEGWLRPEDLDEVLEQVAQQAEAAFLRASSAPDPGPETLRTNVFVNQ